MKNIFKKVLFVAFTLFSMTIIAQKPFPIDMQLIKNDGTTINGKMRVFGGLFNRNNIDIRSFLKTVIIVDDNNKKIESVKARDIKELSYTNLQGEPMKFLNNGVLMKLEVYVGSKIKWYKHFRINAYDQSLRSIEVFIDEKGNEYGVGMFNSLKKKLKELTQSKPELASEIENVKYDHDSILHIIKKYEEE